MKIGDVSSELKEVVRVTHRTRRVQVLWSLPRIPYCSRSREGRPTPRGVGLLQGWFGKPDWQGPGAFPVVCHQGQPLERRRRVRRTNRYRVLGRRVRLAKYSRLAQWRRRTAFLVQKPLLCTQLCYPAFRWVLRRALTPGCVRRRGRGLWQLLLRGSWEGRRFRANGGDAGPRSRSRRWPG